VCTPAVQKLGRPQWALDAGRLPNGVTRCGDSTPIIPLLLAEKACRRAVQPPLSTAVGLLGISKLSRNMQDLLAGPTSRRLRGRRGLLLPGSPHLAALTARLRRPHRVGLHRRDRRHAPWFGQKTCTAWSIRIVLDANSNAGGAGSSRPEAARARRGIATTKS